MVKVTSSQKNRRAPTRLWVKSRFTGYRRNRETQRPNQALLRIEGVKDAKQANYYLGKRCVYIYKAGTTRNQSKFRTIWGRVSTTHGNSGAVIARFSPNLPARAMGANVRVMLYPQRG